MSKILFFTGIKQLFHIKYIVYSLKLLLFVLLYYYISIIIFISNYLRVYHIFICISISKYIRLENYVLE
jgi:hypothetical protein